jgi:uncharacterized protein (TIGR02466 family)
MEANINAIFPTPVYISKLNRELTSLELKFVDKNKKYFYKNVSNITSKNTYILNEKPFINIKKELELKVQDYFDKVISPANNITPYITQSWLNYTEKNQYHHIHNHSNSLISGVFYINCDEKFDRIKFFKDKYSMIKSDIKQYNIWNSEAWLFSVKTGDIILFPSSLNHMVETKEGDNTRISLAFNVFIKGKVGNSEDLTELIL